MCPVGNESSCTVECAEDWYSCKDATIWNAADGVMESFTLLCSAQKACQSITVDLDLQSISVIDIVCNGFVCRSSISPIPCCNRH